MVELAIAFGVVVLLLMMFAIANKRVPECPNCQIPLEIMEPYGFYMCKTCGHSESED